MCNSETIYEIYDILHREEPLLRSLSEEVITTRFNNQNRSIKMLVGHLIDSASNNHQRMVRLQYVKATDTDMNGQTVGVLDFPEYTQDNDLWIRLQDYQHEDWNTLVSLWKFYNLHMIHLIESVDTSAYDNIWFDFENNVVTLRDMIEGYTGHLKLHLAQIHELIGR